MYDAQASNVNQRRTRRSEIASVLSYRPEAANFSLGSHSKMNATQQNHDYIAVRARGHSNTACKIMAGKWLVLFGAVAKDLHVHDSAVFSIREDRLGLLRAPGSRYLFYTHQEAAPSANPHLSHGKTNRTTRRPSEITDRETVLPQYLFAPL